MRLFSIILIPMLPVLAGCVPEAIVWSPEGKTGLVASGGKLYRTDDSGKVEEITPTVANARALSAKECLTPAVWMDNSHYVVVWTRPAREWAQIEAAIPADRRDAITTAAAKLLAQIDRFSDNWNDFAVNAEITRCEALAAWIYLRETSHDKIAEKLGSRCKEIDDLALNIQLVELRGALDSPGEEGKILFESIDPVLTLRPSPDGTMLAVVQPVGRNRQDAASGVSNQPEGRLRLDVVPVNAPEAKKTIDNDVAAWPAWSPDGKTLYYIRSLVNGQSLADALLPGRLQSWQVNKSAEEEPSEPPPPTLELAFHPLTKILCLSTGRLLIPCVEVNYPSISSPSRTVSLYAIDHNGIAGLTKVPLSETSKDITNALAFGSFAASPDGQRLALTSSTGRTGVVHLATGRIEWIQPASVSTGDPSEDKTWFTTAPTWKGATELCFVAPPASQFAVKSRPEVVLWSPKRTSVLSLQWKSENFGDLLRNP